MTTDAAQHVAARYGRFARDEAPGRSSRYEEWAVGVVGDPAMQELLGRIRAVSRQPPLVFAVTRMLGAPEAPYAVWSAWVRAHADEVVAECGRRSIQTNEPLRCAALLPALALVPGPVALLEVGASAGLCLQPDRYSYRFRTPDGILSLDPAGGPSPVVLESAIDGADAPLPALPEIVWRAGVDLEPLDAADEADRRFLTSLVWPGESGRAERITAALDLVAADPPRVVRADATDPGVLEALAAEAPTDAALVVTTPGVLPHIPRAGRERLLAAIRALGARWISLDPPALHETWSRPIDGAPHDGFVLGLDGEGLAEADPLGGWVRWRASHRGNRPPRS